MPDARLVKAGRAGAASAGWPVKPPNIYFEVPRSIDQEAKGTVMMNYKKKGMVCLLSATLVGCATAKLDQPAAVVDSKGGPAKIVSAYLRAGDTAIVRGMIVPVTPLPTTITGHLHISAFAHDGSIIARKTSRWSGTLSGRRREARFYTADLGVHRGDVARLQVVYARERHPPEEGFD